jgi:hypothetical protein
LKREIEVNPQRPCTPFFDAAKRSAPAPRYGRRASQ